MKLLLTNLVNVSKETQYIR